MEKAIAAGGRVEIPLETGLWCFQGGEWKATLWGTLEISGTANAMTFTAPLVGARYELRGEIDASVQGAATVAILLGEHGMEYYVPCALKQSRDGGALRAAIMDRWDEETGRTAQVPLAAPNTFVIRVENNRAIFELNGVNVAERYRAGSSPLDKAHSTVDLAVRGLRSGDAVRVRHLEIQTDFK